MAKRALTVAAIQSSFGPDMAANIAKIEGFVREAAKRGAQLVLAPELFQSIYSRRSRTRNGSRPRGRLPSIRRCASCRRSPRS
jgi:predicted amidohydrolase